MMQTNTVEKSSVNEAAGQALQASLVELLDLSLHARQAHWNVTGPHFRSLHLQLEEMYGEYDPWIDEVAERMAMLGVAPDGRAATITVTSELAGIAEGAIDGANVIRHFVGRLGEVSARLGERIETVESDAVTQDLLIEVKGGLEKQLWMMRAQM